MRANVWLIQCGNCMSLVECRISMFCLQLVGDMWLAAGYFYIDSLKEHTNYGLNAVCIYSRSFWLPNQALSDCSLVVAG